MLAVLYEMRCYLPNITGCRLIRTKQTDKGSGGGVTLWIYEPVLVPTLFTFILYYLLPIKESLSSILTVNTAHILHPIKCALHNGATDKVTIRP